MLNTPALSGRIPQAEDALGNVLPQGRQYLALNFLCNQKLFVSISVLKSYPVLDLTPASLVACTRKMNLRSL